MTLSAQTFVSLLVTMLIPLVILGGAAYLILLERKIASWAQDRLGPNRVGLTFGFLPLRWHMYGLGQPAADGIKMFMKEDHDPAGVDKALFYAAPCLAVIPALIGWAVIPWGGTIEIAGFSLLGLTVEAGVAQVAAAPLNVGVIYILTTGSLAVYGVTIAGWASNNKYSFFGGLRATAQMLSYEIPMGLIVLTALLMAGSAAAPQIADGQVGYYFGFIPKWGILQQPIAAALFFTCLLAEANRAPFDLAEAEQELVGGYHTEYSSSMKLGLLLFSEYIHMVTAGAFFTLLFLGGWHLPYLDLLLYGKAQPVEAGLLGMLIKVGVFLGKVTLMIAVMIWVRWTLPRFRFDQLMQLAWRAIIPLTLAILLMTGTMVFLGLRDWLWLGNIGIVALVLAVRPLIPSGPPVNRRVAFTRSRFSKPVAD